MSENAEIKSILDMVQGGVKEIINESVAEILLNIRDLNTDLKKRELVVKISFSPADYRRKKINVTYQTTPKLRPINPVETSIYADFDDNGQLMAKELLEEISGQFRMDGEEEPQPVIINFTAANKKAANK